jgi:hypothetical protein
VGLEDDTTVEFVLSSSLSSSSSFLSFEFRKRRNREKELGAESSFGF